MLISLLIGAGVVSGAALVARRLWVRRLERQQEPPTEPETRRAPGELAVSDVVLYLDQEFWLSGCVELMEDDETVLRLFRTPGAEPILWLAELGRRGAEIVLFRETDFVPGGRVSDEIPIGGRSLRLTRRGRADVALAGENLPSVAERSEFALLADGSGRRLLVLDFTSGSRWALLGEQVNRELLDILPGSHAEPAPTP